MKSKNLLRKVGFIPLVRKLYRIKYFLKVNVYLNFGKFTV